MPQRTRTVTDADGGIYEVFVRVDCYDESGSWVSRDTLRDALPGPVLERLRDQLRDDVEVMV